MKKYHGKASNHSVALEVGSFIFKTIFIWMFAILLAYSIVGFMQ
jgi:hypothetical protein